MKWVLLGAAVGALVCLGVVCWACEQVTEHVTRLDELIDGPRCDHCTDWERHVGEALALSRENPLVNVAYSDFAAWDAELAQHRREWGAK